MPSRSPERPAGRFFIKLFLYTLALLGLVVVIFAWNRPSVHVRHPQLIDVSGSPVPPLQDIFSAFGSSAHTLDEMNTFAQRTFLRAPGKERWEVGERADATQKMDQLLPAFKALDMVDARLPSGEQYDYILIFGGTIESMRIRLQYLDSLWEKGVRARTIVFLTGLRPLDPTIEDQKHLLDPLMSQVPFEEGWGQKAGNLTLKTEHDAAQLARIQVLHNRNLRAQPIHYVATPMIQAKDGTIRRPNTRDTILFWLKIDPNTTRKDLKILAISDAPVLPYQDAVLRHTLKQARIIERDLQVETVGPGTRTQKDLALFLDTLARWIYTTVTESQTPAPATASPSS